ncbi:MAG: TfuA-like protein [Pseudomonadota bacterium]
MDNRRCVFAGPSLSGVSSARGVDFFAPASLGSLYLAYEKGYRVIGLVDGFFGSVPAVWHKEILHLMKLGVRVVGSSSIGALRAVELETFGMMGVGAVFRLYRRGSILDEDEVCVVHAPGHLGFLPLSIAMIDLRFFFRSLKRTGVLSVDDEVFAIDAMKRLHFSDRTLDKVSDLLRGLGALKGDLNRTLRDSVCAASIKRSDALKLVRFVRGVDGDFFEGNAPNHETEYWRRVYQSEYDMIPRLTRWATNGVCMQKNGK